MKTWDISIFSLWWLKLPVFSWQKHSGCRAPSPEECLLAPKLSWCGILSSFQACTRHLEGGTRIFPWLNVAPTSHWARGPEDSAMWHVQVEEKKGKVGKYDCAFTLTVEWVVLYSTSPETCVVQFWCYLKHTSSLTTHTRRIALVIE